MNKVQLIQECFLNMLAQKGVATTLEVKEELIKSQPAFFWKQREVSDVIMELSVRTQIDYTTDSVNGYRTYYAQPIGISNFATQVINQTAQSETNEELFVKALDIATKNSSVMSKRHFKLLYQGDKDVFNDLWDEHFGVRIQFSGKRNTENHNLYVFLESKQHFSKTKGKTLDISNMHPAHIRNTIKKNYPNVTLEELVDAKDDEEFVILVKGYFNNNLLHKLSNVISNLV